MEASTRKVEYAAVPAGNIHDLILLLKLTDDDAEMFYLNMILKTASDSAERYMNRSLITCSWERVFTGRQVAESLALNTKKGKPFYLPYPPVTAITEVRLIYGETNYLVTSGEYDADLSSEPAVLYMPIGLYPFQRLCVKYEAGYGDSYASIPPAIQQGVLQHSAYMYSHRGDCDANEALNKSGAMALYAPYKVGVI